MIKKHFSATFTIKCLGFIAALIQGIFVTRLLGPEGKGVFSLFQANVAFLSLFLGLTLPHGVNYFVASGKLNPPKVLTLGALFTVIAVAAILIILGISQMSSLTKLLIPDGYATPFFLSYLVTAFFFAFAGNLYYSLLSGLSHFYLLSGLELGIAVLRVAIFASVYFLKLPSTSIESIFLLDLAFAGLQCVLYFFLTRFHLKMRFDWSINWNEHIAPMLKLVLPLYGTSLLTFLYGRADLWIVQHFNGLADLGLYSLAGGTAQLLTFFPIAINTVLSTYLSKSSDESRRFIFSALSRLNFWVVLLGAIALVCTADFLLPKLYGNEFEGSSGPLKILVWGTLFSTVKFLFLLYNQITLRANENILCEVLVLGISLTLSFLFIPRWGIMGASASMTVANFLGLCFLLRKISQRGDLDLISCFVPSKSDWLELTGIVNRFSSRQPPIG